MTMDTTAGPALTPHVFPENGGRGGSGWICTFTGRRFYPLDPDPAEIDIRDIAHALAMIPRYAGHCAPHYSVAQHSVLVSRLVPPEHALWGLLHDSSEAYLGDVPRPLKRLPIMAAYREAEQRLMAAVCIRFGLPRHEPSIVSEVDARMVPTEAAQIFERRHAAWRDTVDPLNVEIVSLSPRGAEDLFLAQFRILMARSARMAAVASSVALIDSETE